MAVGQVATYNGTAGITAGAAATASVTALAGEVLIVVAGGDNRAATDPFPANAVTDAAGNTWVRLLSRFSTATAATHVGLAIFGCTVTNPLTAQNVTLAGPQPVKDMTVYRFTGLSLTIRGLNSGLATGTTPSAQTTSAPLVGDLVIGATVLEGPTSDTWTADADTTGGSWSANATDGTTGGTATSQVSIRSQYKIVNAAGTQTYNGSNSTSRDMARGILVLAPTPPPTSNPPPPLYRAKDGIQFSVGSGRIVVGQVDAYAFGPNFDRRLPPLIYNSGVASPAEDITGVYLPSVQPIVHAFVDLGFAVVSPTTLYTYGNATSQAAITAAAAWARTNLGCSSLPFPIFGGSEGACDSLTYAYVNPALVACVVGVIPVIDLAEMVEQNVLGLGSTILSAWGVGALPLPVGADPNTTAHRVTLANVPMQLWYATNDEVSANITSFQAATGADVKAVGALGHTDAAIAAAHPIQIAEFIRKRVAVPYSSRLF